MATPIESETLGTTEESAPKTSDSQPPHIVEKIQKFLVRHRDAANWWWREPEGRLFQMFPIGSFYFRQMFNDASYFYELTARQGLSEGTSPAYPEGKPFNKLSFEVAWSVWTKVEKINREGLHIVPLDFAEQLSQSLPGVQRLLQIDLANHKDGQATEPIWKVTRTDALRTQYSRAGKVCAEGERHC